MKWFLTVCAIAGGIGVALASCGPEKAFCPTTNPDPTDLSCHPNQDAMATGGEMGSMCDGPEVVCPGTSGQVKKCSFAECP
jgi:hypothetical protein